MYKHILVVVGCGDNQNKNGGKVQCHILMSSVTVSWLSTYDAQYQIFHL
jgi:hypothetical protein